MSRRRDLVTKLTSSHSSPNNGLAPPNPAERSQVEKGSEAAASRGGNARRADVSHLVLAATNTAAAGSRDGRHALDPLHPYLEQLMTRLLDCSGSLAAQVSIFGSDSHVFTYTRTSDGILNSGSTGGPAQGSAMHRAVESRRAVVVADAQRKGEWRVAPGRARGLGDSSRAAFLLSYRSEIAIPLSATASSNKIIAVLSLHHKDKHGFDAYCIRKLKRIWSAAARPIENAIPTATAIDNPVLQEEMQDAFEQISRPAEQDGILSESIFDRIAIGGAKLARAEYTGIWMNYSATDELHFVAEAAPSTDEYKTFRIKLNQGIRGKVLREGKAYYCPDTSKDPFWSKCIQAVQSCYVVPIRSSVPIRSAPTSIGVICFDSLRADAFSPTLRKALDTFAAMCSLLISTTLSEIERSVETQARIPLADAGDEAELCRRAVDIACRLTGAEGASLFLVDSAAQKLRLASSTGLAPGYESQTDYPLDPTQGLTPWVAVNGVGLRLKKCGDKNELSRWGHDLKWKGRVREVGTRRGFNRPHLSIPVRDGCKTLGVLRASGKRDQSQFTEEDKNALVQLVRLLSAEMQNPRTTGSPLSEDMARLWQDQWACLARILNKCIELSKADAGGVYVLEGNSLVCYAHCGELVVDPQTLTQALGCGSVIDICAKTRTAQIVDDVSQSAWRNIFKSHFAEIKSEMVIPLIYLGEFCGVINLESKHLSFFNRRGQAHVEMLASVAAGYIVYQRLSQIRRTETRVFSNIWKDLFSTTTGWLEVPAAIESSGYIVSRPHGGVTGGDFHKMTRLSEKAIGVAIGDGEGHAAAGTQHMLPLFTALCSCCHSTSAKHVLETMSLVARDMHVRGTAAYFTITRTAPNTWLLSGASAAHPKLIVLQSNGDTRFPRSPYADQGPLGVLNDRPLAEDSMELCSGDTIIGYTDGILDDLSHNSWSDATREVIGAVSGPGVLDAGAEAIAQTLESWVLSKSNGMPRDDFTIVIIRIGEKGPDAPLFKGPSGN